MVKPIGAEVGVAGVVVKAVPADDAALAGLIERLDAYLARLYPADEIFGVDFSDPATRNMAFAVAYLDGRPVGCGGIRSLDSATAELKRFYVEPDVRRAGIAGSVCRFLEKRAAELGHSLLRLETGEPQFESIRFYSKQGFYPIERFGEYVHCESSYCMEKRISP
ncbi:MAG: N-acetyltransferase [Paenibacillus sp.]|nr:N-acetyltransferase [Paenibacillus sp.]